MQGCDWKGSHVRGYRSRGKIEIKQVLGGLEAKVLSKVFFPSLELKLVTAGWTSAQCSTTAADKIKTQKEEVKIKEKQIMDWGGRSLCVSGLDRLWKDGGKDYVCRSLRTFHCQAQTTMVSNASNIRQSIHARRDQKRKFSKSVCSQ